MLWIVKIGMLISIVNFLIYIFSYKSISFEIWFIALLWAYQQLKLDLLNILFLY